MKKGFFHVPGYFYLIFESKKKKRIVYLLVIYFLSIFVPLLFPLPKK